MKVGLCHVLVAEVLSRLGCETEKIVGLSCWRASVAEVLSRLGCETLS